MYTRRFSSESGIPLPGNYSGSLFGQRGEPEDTPTEEAEEAREEDERTEAAPEGESETVAVSAKGGKRALPFSGLGNLLRTDWLSGDLLLLVLLLLLLGEDGEDDLLPMMLILLFFVR